MNNNPTQIKRALISVSDKTGLTELAQGLAQTGVEIISTGGTATHLRAAGLTVKDISDFTGFPEIMDGRVKTLHPKVHGGILGRRDEHAEVAKENNIEWIDLVVCNLYPFAKTIQKNDVKIKEAIENIDIGGPSMIRSAAKNVDWVGVVVEPSDYNLILEEIKSGGLKPETRWALSAKAFRHTAAYDAVIAKYFTTEIYPEKLTLTYKKYYDLRYGENPHQSACVYRDNLCKENNLLSAKIIQGKQLSYNNLNDADGAWALTREFSKPAAIVVKHANPCGVATGTDINEVFKRAYTADSLSAFGGIISLNRPCTEAIAAEIIKVFAEIVLAPSYDEGALKLLATKPNLRVLELGVIAPPSPRQTYREILGGMLVQDNDNQDIKKENLKVVTKLTPSDEELNTMLFAWKVLKYVKSNAILIAKNNTTVGIGVGQVSRVDAVDLAIKKAGQNIVGSVLASDAFFPFKDSIDKIAPTGIKAIIQPGGSIKDAEIIAACDALELAMVFTGTRCFRH